YRRHIKIETDEGSEEGDFIFGAVCNTVSMGGMNLFGKTDVKLNDGKLELLLIRAPKNIIDVQQIIATLSKGSTENPNIFFKQIKKAKFTCDSEVAWTIDGEYGGSGTDADICICEKAITVRTGKICLQHSL
ncbi:MAG: diacylglycerol kinase family lipid kinase, partial [Lachnospiraceae bacterium]|nr:diacylglycerol kinase family lipid kinase [Lachnospiraceae bacterium]